MKKLTRSPRRTDHLREGPGKLTSGSTIGIAPYLLLEFLRACTGIDMVFVPYKGAAPAIADVLSNQIQVTVSAKSVLLPLIKAGKLSPFAKPIQTRPLTRLSRQSTGLSVNSSPKKPA